MPSKGSQAKTAKASANLRMEAERSIQKERYKDAVKQAKMCYKEEGTPENHRLLERAYFLRACQLVQLGMRESAVEVAGHLLEFGVTGSDALEELVRLLISLGFEKPAFQIQERLGAPELKGRLSELAADQLVIHPHRAGATAPELARDAQLVRRALEKLQAQDEAAALELLRNLARSSPLSEWKFLVRGLAAFYRGDAAETQANWGRLDPKRTAYAITERLHRLAAERSETDPKKLEALEKLIFGEPILDRLQQVRSLAASQEWDKVTRLLGPLRQALHRVDPTLAQRLTVILIGSLVKGAEDMRWADAHRVVTNFTRLAQPIAIDPHWNRLWGMLWDGPQGDPDQAIAYWVAYINDLKTVAAFSPSERDLAQALVWNHVAGLHRQEVDDLTEPDESFGPPFPGLGRHVPGAEADEQEIAAAKKNVIDCLERSLKLAPQYLPAYRALIAVYNAWGDHKKLEAAAQRLLAAFPEDGETLQLLARHYFERNDLAAALPAIQKARRLKPLDESLREQEWMIRVGLARNCALSQRWDEGRAEFAAAEELLPDCRQQFFYLARKAIFELKAEPTDRSDQYLRDARGLLVEPAPLWLALTIESIRYKMPKAATDTYAQLWEAELKKKCRSETAGELADLMRGFLGAGITYRGRDEHIQEVVAYLKRGTRLKYRREDIEHIVEFLDQLPKPDPDFLGKMVKTGLKQHPDSALLHLRMAIQELSAGTLFGGSDAPRHHLETALKLAEASTDPKVTALIAEIRTQLSMVEEVAQRVRGFRSFFGGGPFGMPYGGDLDFDDDDEDDEDFDEDDEDFFPGPRPGPAPARRRGKKRAPRKRR